MRETPQQDRGCVVHIEYDALTLLPANLHHHGPDEPARHAITLSIQTMTRTSRIITLGQFIQSLTMHRRETAVLNLEPDQFQKAATSIRRGLGLGAQSSTREFCRVRNVNGCFAQSRALLKPSLPSWLQALKRPCRMGDASRGARVPGEEEGGRVAMAGKGPGESLPAPA